MLREEKTTSYSQMRCVGNAVILIISNALTLYSNQLFSILLPGAQLLGHTRNSSGLYGNGVRISYRDSLGTWWKSEQVEQTSRHFLISAIENRAEALSISGCFSAVLANYEGSTLVVESAEFNQNE